MDSKTKNLSALEMLKIWEISRACAIKQQREREKNDKRETST